MSFTAYDIVRKFEEVIAEYAGSKYAVAVDSCCGAIFLSCVYQKKNGWKVASIPKFTYPGVACSVINSGLELEFNDLDWKGRYGIMPISVIDSALRFKKGMYIKDSYYCVSFHAKKHLPIGRGGMILTDDVNAYSWFKRARFDGRREMSLKEDNINMIGWNMYMTPEQAARGLMLFDLVKNENLEDIDNKSQGYPDLSKIKVYQNG